MCEEKKKDGCIGDYIKKRKERLTATANKSTDNMNNKVT